MREKQMEQEEYQAYRKLYYAILKLAADDGDEEFVNSKTFAAICRLLELSPHGIRKGFKKRLATDDNK